MSVSFDTNTYSGFTMEGSLPWYRKLCPECNRDHGVAKHACQCGYSFTKKEKVEVKPRAKRVKKTTEAQTAENPQTTAAPITLTDLPVPKTPKKKQSRASLIHERLANYYNLISIAHKELSEIT